MEEPTFAGGQESELPVVSVNKVPPLAPPPPGKFQSLEIITRLVQAIDLALIGVTLFAALMCIQCRAMMAEIETLRVALRNVQPERSTQSS